MRAKPEGLDDAKVEAQVLELRVVQRQNGGRPLFLDARRFIRICLWIEQGESAVEACRREFVTYQSFREHVTRQPKYQKRLKQAELIREGVHREYHIANIVKHAPRNVLASLWWLERRYPAEFALRAVNRDNGASEGKAIGEAIPAERLFRYGKLMLEMAEENRARETTKVAELPESSEAV